MSESNPANVRWLSFRLHNGQTIGPEKLRQAWIQAAGHPRCEVRREVSQGGLPIYFLYGPAYLVSPKRAEDEIRAFLTKGGYVFTMTHIVGNGQA